MIIDLTLAEIAAIKAIARKLDGQAPEPAPEPTPEPTPAPEPTPPPSSSFSAFWGRGFALLPGEDSRVQLTKHGVRVRDDGTITWRVHIPTHPRKQQIALFCSGFSSSANTGIKVQEVGGSVVVEGTFGYLTGSLPTSGGDGPKFHIGVAGVPRFGIYELKAGRSYDITLTLLYQDKPHRGEFKLIDWKLNPR